MTVVVHGCLMGHGLSPVRRSCLCSATQANIVAAGYGR